MINDITISSMINGIWKPICLFDFIKIHFKIIHKKNVRETPALYTMNTHAYKRIYTYSLISHFMENILMDMWRQKVFFHSSWRSFIIQNINHKTSQFSIYWSHFFLHAFAFVWMCMCFRDRRETAAWIFVSLYDFNAFCTEIYEAANIEKKGTRVAREKREWWKSRECDRRVGGGQTKANTVGLWRK